MTLAEIKANLDHGEFDFLIGQLEDEHLEAKKAGYDLKKGDEFKLELAKDVSSFANMTGGIIIIGARTSDKKKEAFRKITDLSPFVENLIDTTTYHNIIREWVYPEVVNVEVMWRPSARERDKGLVYIYIPEQQENSRPFLVKRDVDPTTGAKLKEVFFGYIQRISHSSMPHGIQSIHTMLRLGNENRFREEVNSKLQIVLSRLEQREDEDWSDKLDTVLAARIEEALISSHLDKQRYYCLATCPAFKTEVRSLLSSTEGSIAHKMDNPPRVRENGWGLNSGSPSKLESGQFRRNMIQEQRVMDLYRDGTLIFACRADEANLGHNFTNKQINPIALVETTFVYFKFYGLVLKDFTKSIEELRIFVQMDNLHKDGIITSLHPYDTMSISQGSMHERKEARDHRYSTIIQLATNPYDESEAAFKALREVYSWFGIEEQKIPYQNSRGGRIDEREFLR